ncbi:MAG TPA: GAF and ANTAR domain-containing protein [Pseudolysinimonas sp.]|nr:GAF and ANTAR domain-containing protein [Pseudolysinimonas sp.]
MADSRDGRSADATKLCAPFRTELPITWASVSVFDGAGRQSTICASDPVAARLDELQLELGEGPQWDALRTASPVLISSLDGPPSPWPAFAAAARQLGVNAVFAFPMFFGAVGVGVVGLASPTVVTLSSADISTAIRLTSRITRAAVLHALRGAEQEQPTEGLAAPAMRREVHQATGMILAQLDISATEAFVRLRAHAFATSRSVHDVARDVVARVLDFRDLPS